MGLMALATAAAASTEAPPWMHAVANVPLPAHDEKTDAVLLYSEKTVTVRPNREIDITVREAYKILRPSGREHGLLAVDFNPRRRITGVHGWCIPASGRDYEVKERDAAEVSLPKIEGSELISDVKAKLLQIPAADPGNIIGYEYRTEEQPLVLQDVWRFQQENPVRESRYTLQLPSGWEYKAAWLNYPEAHPTEAGGNQWQWTLGDVKAIRPEEQMPPAVGVAGLMMVSFFPPGGAGSDSFADWRGMGAWYQRLTKDRRDADPQIKAQVAALTASAATPLDKMKAIARFVQDQVRYVAIELGIGGWQPHPASEVFAHRYGDCKDKATLMAAMLSVIGVDSYYVVINSERGSITPDSPPYIYGFDHVILAIKLPEGTAGSSLVATMQHPKLGRILFFDPTDELTPFGQLHGRLQDSYAMLVTPDGGELIEVPELPGATTGINRKADLTLDASGNLKGDVTEIRRGDRAASERWALRTMTKDSDRIKLIETVLADSLPNFQITKATLLNFTLTDLPLGFNYSFEAANYARTAGQLLLVRPRVIGSKSSALLETKEPRQFPVEFDGPEHDVDTFEITLPPGYLVEDLPPPVDVDYSFASYHSKTEAVGSTIRYGRTFDVKELTVPAARSEELKKFYRIIASDERNTAVLRLGSQ